MNPQNSKRFAIFVSFLFVLSPSFLFAEGQAQENANSAMAKKLQTIVLPKVELKQVPFPEALEIIRKQSRAHDPEKDPEKKGVNFIIKGSVKDNRKFTLMLTNVSLADALRYLCDLSGYKFSCQQNSVIFESADAEPQ